VSSETPSPVAPPAEPEGFGQILAAIGEPILFVVTELTNIFKVFLLTMFYVIRRPIRWSEVMRQCYDIGNR
jgi:ABC-type transporter Mla maintaining outer membrane lipid asymmetry permease subunit MlaE